MVERVSDPNTVDLDTEMAHIVIAGVKEAGGQVTEAYHFIEVFHKNWIRSLSKL